jgi:hypothetical protein
VRYRSGTQRRDRTAVMVYLGEDGNQLVFDAPRSRDTAHATHLGPRGRTRTGGHSRLHQPGRAMSARRYVVRRLDGYRRGDRRRMVWDTARGGWADDAQSTRRAAQGICDEPEAQAAASTPQPEPAAGLTRHYEEDVTRTLILSGRAHHVTLCNGSLQPGAAGPDRERSLRVSPPRARDG